MTPEWRDLCLYNFCSFDDVSDFGFDCIHICYNRKYSGFIRLFW